MTRGIRIACAVAFLATLSALAGQAELQLSISMQSAAWSVGEPVAVQLVLRNPGEVTVYVQRGALDGDLLAESVLVLRTLPDGTQEAVAVDAPSTPPPPGFAPIDGSVPPVWVAATAILPGASVELSVPNLLRLLPFLAAGAYEVLALVQLPTSGIAEVDANGDLWMELGSAEGVAALSNPLTFQVVAPAGASDADLERLTAARAPLNRATSAEDAVGPFAALAVEAADSYVRACAAYWVGEAHERFGRHEEAAAAYLEVIRRFPDSIFRAHAEARLGELAGAAGS